MRLHKKIRFEVELCQCLSQNGWLYAEGDAAGYHRARVLFPADVLIGDAIDQYRFDRNPRNKGQPAEPLLSFPHGALVHFSVSNKVMAMVTRLDGPATVFLPFNLGDDGAAGNPVNAAGGHRTA